MSKQAKTQLLMTRVSPATKLKFYERAAQLQLTPSDVVRELVACFLEGRVTITPADN